MEETKITGDAAKPTVEIVLPRNPSVKEELDRASDHQNPPTR
jgi:hypothetical protein